MNDVSMENTIITAIINWIVADRKQEQLDEIELAADSLLLEKEIFDSLKILQFVDWLEKTYGVTIKVDNLTRDFFASPQIIAEGVIKLQQV